MIRVWIVLSGRVVFAGQFASTVLLSDVKPGIVIGLLSSPTSNKFSTLKLFTGSKQLS